MDIATVQWSKKAEMVSSVTKMGKNNKPVQRERRKDHMQLSGKRRWTQRRRVGMMEQRRKRRDQLCASQRCGLTD